VVRCAPSFQGQHSHWLSDGGGEGLFIKGFFFFSFFLPFFFLPFPTLLPPQGVSSSKKVIEDSPFPLFLPFFIQSFHEES